MVNEDNNKLICDVFRLLSALLQFPDEDLIESLAYSRPRVEKVLADTGEDRLHHLVRYLLDTPLLKLQEAYSETFDLNPDRCLNLTYHRYGDNKERGAALARFAEAYEKAGFERTTRELPDYLPMVLEFFSLCDLGDLDWIRTDYARPVAELARRLKENDNPYSCVFENLAEIFESVKPGKRKIPPAPL